MKSNFKHAVRARKKQMPQQKAASDPNGQVKNMFQACTADQLAQQLTVAEHYVYAAPCSSSCTALCLVSMSLSACVSVSVCVCMSVCLPLSLSLGLDWLHTSSTHLSLFLMV